MTDEEFQRRSKEDFEFLALCQAKQNMGMYRLLRDDELAAERDRRSRDSSEPVLIR